MLLGSPTALRDFSPPISKEQKTGGDESRVSERKGVEKNMRLGK